MITKEENLDKTTYNLDRFNITHNYKYNYPSFKYVNCFTKFEANCPIHGSFITNTHKHVNSKMGCPRCSCTYTPTKEEIICELKNKFYFDKNGVYEGCEIDEYSTTNKPLIIIDNFGFKHRLYLKSLRNGVPLSIINAINKTEYFLFEIKDYFKEGGVLFGCYFMDFKYVSAKTHVIIRDINGLNHRILTDSIKYKNKLTIESAIDKTKYIICLFKLVHGNKYDYSLVKYVNYYTKVKIICSIHGIFDMSPDIHLRSANCPKCIGHYTPTTEEFLVDLKNKGFLKEGGIHENINFKDFIYTKQQTLSIVYDKNNIKHLIRPISLLCGHNLSIKSAVDKTAYIITQFKLIHGDRYDYSLVIYKGYNYKVKIICKTHGIFEILPDAHLSGSGCQLCANGGFNPNKEGYFYIIELEKGGIKSIGYGISNIVKKRINQHKRTFKETNTKYTVLAIYHFEYGFNTLKMETMVKKHNTNVNFGIEGFRSECLEYESKDYLINLLNENPNCESVDLSILKSKRKTKICELEL